VEVEQTALTVALAACLQAEGQVALQAVQAAFSAAAAATPMAPEALGVEAASSSNGL
jgi:hypothetical protein